MRIILYLCNTYIDNIRRLRTKSLFDRYAQILQIDGIFVFGNPFEMEGRQNENKTVVYSLRCCCNLLLLLVFLYFFFVYVYLYDSTQPLLAHIHIYTNTRERANTHLLCAFIQNPPEKNYSTIIVC